MMISFLLALLCLLPMGLYQLFGPENGNPVGLGLIMVLGFPFFSLLSVIGMLVWGYAEIRHPTVNKQSDNH